MNCDGCGRRLQPWDVMDCGACKGAFCAGCVDEHECKGKPGGRTSSIAISTPKVVCSTIGVKALAEQFLALGDEKWREYIDFALHHLGKTAIDQGGGPEGQREAFSANMDRAVEFATKHLGQALTLELYVGLFKCCAGHLAEKNECRYRSSGEVITLGTDVKMGDEAVRELSEQAGAMAGVNSLSRESGGDIIGMNFPGFMPDLINALFGEFHLELGGATDAEGRLLAIARLVQNLERLHPFRNANGRTNILLLNKLLTEWGFHPAILDDPNEAPFLSVLEWCGKVRKGLFRWAIFQARLGRKRQVSRASGWPSASLFRARQTVRIGGRDVSVGAASGVELECLFDSIHQLLPFGHAQGGLGANALRQWLVARYREHPGAVSPLHILELENGGMGNLMNDVPALARLLGVRIRIFVQGGSGDVWLEFDSAGGDHLHVIDILHQGIHFVPLGVPPQTPLDDRQGGPLSQPSPALLQSLLPRVEGRGDTSSNVGPKTLTERGTGREGGLGSVMRSPTLQKRKYDRVVSPTHGRRGERDRPFRSNDDDRRPDRHDEERCYFCDRSTRAGRRVRCVTSRGCDVRRPACESCYDRKRDNYRCREHR